MHRALTSVLLDALQRWCPGCREWSCGSKRRNKAAVLPLMQTSETYQSTAAVHIRAVWVQRSHWTCRHRSFWLDCPSAGWAALALLCCPVALKCKVVCEEKVGLWLLKSRPLLHKSLASHNTTQED